MFEMLITQKEKDTIIKDRLLCRHNIIKGYWSDIHMNIATKTLKPSSITALIMLLKKHIAMEEGLIESLESISVGCKIKDELL